MRHWQVSKTQKQTPISKRFSVPACSKSPYWLCGVCVWVCRVCGTNCVWTQNHVHVWMWGDGRDSRLTRRDLLCRLCCLVKGHSLKVSADEYMGPNNTDPWWFTGQKKESDRLLKPCPCRQRGFLSGVPCNNPPNMTETPYAHGGLISPMYA